METFKAIPDYKGLYEINKNGNIKSLERTVTGKNNSIRKIKGKILSSTKDSSGYLQVSLYKNGKAKRITVHKVMELTFFKKLPIGSKLVIDHHDNIITNNKLNNLKRVTQRVNTSKDRFRQNSTSKFVGVSWSKQSKKWHARITINNHYKHLGYYKDENDAHIAYQNKLLIINEENNK